MVKADSGHSGTGVRQAWTAAETAAALRQVGPGPWLVEEVVAGQVVDLSAIFRNRRLVHFTFSYELERLGRFGPSSLRRYHPTGECQRVCMINSRAWGTSWGSTASRASRPSRRTTGPIPSLKSTLDPTSGWPTEARSVTTLPAASGIPSQAAIRRRPVERGRMSPTEGRAGAAVRPTVTTRRQVSGREQRLLPPTSPPWVPPATRPNLAALPSRQPGRLAGSRPDDSERTRVTDLLPPSITFHIGPGKTGSTSVQAALADAAARRGRQPNVRTHPRIRLERPPHGGL